MGGIYSGFRGHMSILSIEGDKALNA